MRDELIHSVGLTPQQLNNCLKDFVNLLETYPVEVRVSFKSLYAEDIFINKELPDQVCSPKKIIELVTFAEKKGRISLGWDYDLSIKIADDEILFCHHSEIHLPKDPKTQVGIELLRILREQNLVLKDWWLF